MIRFVRLPPRAGAPVSVWVRILSLALLATTAGSSGAQNVAPRSARLEPVEGSVALAAAGEREWTDAKGGRNLQRGDRLWVDPRSRAEVQLSRDLLRIEGPAHLHLAEINTRTTQLNLTQGTMQARVRTPVDAHHFDLNTPNLAFRAEQPGDYRIDVDRARNFTRVAVLSGRGTVYGASGQRLPITAGQQIDFGGTALAKQGEAAVARTDAFSRWSDARDQQLATSPPVPRVTTAIAGGPRADVRPVAPRTQSTATVAVARPRTEVRPARASPASSVPANGARREAWQREQAALSEQWKKEHAAYEARRSVDGTPGIPILRQGPRRP